MRVPSRVAVLAAALSIVAAACSSTSASPSPTPQPTPAPTVAPTATATPTAAPTAAPTPTPAPTPTAAATPTSKPIVLPAPRLVHGQYILYETSITLPGNNFQPQLWLIKPDGTGAKKIADGIQSGPLSPARYNLDGVWARSAAVIHSTAYPNACTPAMSDIPFYGGAAIPKLNMTNKDAGFLWSPNGAQIAYWHFTGADEICEQNGLDMTRDLMVMNANGSSKKVVRANIPWLWTPTAWLPNGTGIVAKTDASMWVWVSLSGVTNSFGITADQLVVSPNWQSVAYLKNGHVWVRPFLNGFSKDLGAATDFAWRPDSAALAICGGQLAVVNVTTAATQNVFAFATSKPSWSPDGKQIVFKKTSGGGLYVATVATSSIATLPGTSLAFDVSWQP